MSRKLHFDTVPEAYERARPGYPYELVEDVRFFAKLPAAESLSILDIGCGTGKSSEDFLTEHCRLVGVDIGPGMVRFCRNKFRDYPNASFVVSAFEDWQPPAEGRLDLIVSGTAFHWIEAGVAYAKVADLLRPGGSVAIFWHTFLSPETPDGAEFDHLHREYAPELHVKDLRASQEASILRREQEFLLSGRFQDTRIVRYHRVRHFTADEYIMLLKTFSSHAQLPDDRRDKLFAAIGEVINRHGGILEQPVLTTLCFGRRTE